MIAIPVAGRWSRRRLARRPLAAAAWAVLALYAVVILIGPLVIPGDPLAQTSDQLLPAFSPGHLLGTDDLGRDQLLRLLHGGQPLLLVSIASTALATVIGTALGMVAGFFGRGADTAVMRAMDIVLAFPLVLVAILMVAVLGGGAVNMTIAITISQVPYFARLARNLTLRERTQDYVRSARALGVSRATVLGREILPNLTGSLLVQATSTLAVAAGLASALSYLGLGLNASTPDWGYMVKAGQEFMFSNPGLVLVPGLLITVFAVACNFAGDDLSDAFDTGSRR
ncbi:ABC transporter permease [Amycolatopsis thermoflava]|uniref:ABC transporter permease n=1 Tax=Amycolatopsis thermoflava TaxID=84480 RepID=UPI0004236908|nr:ABC transporter permease [Amycolatopsis thermoflava]